MDGVKLDAWATRHIHSLVAAIWILAFLFLLAFMQNRDAEADASPEYVKALEAIVDKCTNPGDNLIQIDNELYLCGAANTGIKVKP